MTFCWDDVFDENDGTFGEVGESIIVVVLFCKF